MPTLRGQFFAIAELLLCRKVGNQLSESESEVCLGATLGRLEVALLLLVDLKAIA